MAFCLAGETGRSLLAGENHDLTNDARVLELATQGAIEIQAPVALTAPSLSGAEVDAAMTTKLKMMRDYEVK